MKFEPSLAPQAATWKASRSGGDWVAPYRQQLEELDRAGKLAEIVARLPEGAILCYEADWNECHRKVLADYLNEHGLAQVTEFQRPPRSAL
jgi:uncharacterized protein (DUF488 family)